MKIAVIGAGYVGLVTGACFSDIGHSVHVINRDPEKAASINAGHPPIYEKGLDDLLKRNIGRTLFATTDYEKIRESDLVFICVGTPCEEDGSADLTMVRAASRSIGETLKRTDRSPVIILKSTVPPGTTENVVQPIVLENAGRRNIGFAMNPEFLREGRAVEDFYHPDRIVIGSSDIPSFDMVASAYRGIDAPILRTSLNAAEMIKWVSNAFLATKISFSNEIGNICKRSGIDVYEVMKGVGMDTRISPHFLNAGVGFGGSCFPKDVSALINFAESSGEDPIR
jgi:UDPglucose 6-dehydrogenase